MIKISFGIIALNAQPFLEYNLLALYPFAHQIIVVEGATRAAKTLATSDGHSLDGTLEMLQKFRAKHDPENKLRIILAADVGYLDNFWPEKDEMSRAYAQKATGNWLWQIDSDEFYKEKDMQAVINMLASDPSISAVSFPYLEFFGGFDFVISGKWHLVEYPRVNRVFRWGRRYSYYAHRPTTILDEKGDDLRKKNHISSPSVNGNPIYMYHYSYVLPKQAIQKVGYYSNVDWTEAFRGNEKWLKESYFGLKHPFFLGEKGWPTFQWLERFSGKHPSAIEKLRADLMERKVEGPMRQTGDIERLLTSSVYVLTTRILRIVLVPYWRLMKWVRGLFNRQTPTPYAG